MPYFLAEENCDVVVLRVLNVGHHFNDQKNPKSTFVRVAI